MTVKLSRHDKGEPLLASDQLHASMMNDKPMQSKWETANRKQQSESDIKKKGLRLNLSPFVLVGRAGFEPATNGLKVRCSTS